MIEDLDVIVESAPTWRDRWLLPALGTLALAAVLASTFVQLAPVRAGVTQHVSSASVIQGAAPGTGIRSLELPRTVATIVTRTHLSGVTGLTPMDLSEGFRDLYRFEDGRLLIVVEYPDPSGTTVAVPSGALTTPHRLTVRGMTRDRVRDGDREPAVGDRVARRRHAVRRRRRGLRRGRARSAGGAAAVVSAASVEGMYAWQW